MVSVVRNTIRMPRKLRNNSVDIALPTSGLLASTVSDTPLKQFVTSQQNLVRHCPAIHEVVGNS
jgi:hypothetical protein